VATRVVCARSGHEHARHPVRAEPPDRDQGDGIGVFGATVKRTRVAITAARIRAARITLGLIAA
jgi:hypothetical protein